jgi:branched-chain amino acid transport system permease protein
MTSADPVSEPLPPLRRSLGRAPAIGLIAVAAVIFAALPLVLPSYQLSVATQILIFALLAMSIDVLAGFAGRTSLGHGAIFGLSTYVAIYWTANLAGSWPVALLLGLGAATRARHDRLGGVPALDERDGG